MEFLPSLPPVPSDQVAALDGNVASESGNNATGSYDETFMAVLAGRQGPTPLPLPTLSELEGGESLPLDTHSAGNELPANLAAGKVEGVVPVSPLLAWPHINTATVGELDAEIPTRAGEARYLPTARGSVPLAAYEQTTPSIVLDRQLPSNPQAAMSSTTVLPAPLQVPLLPEGRSTRQETADAATGVASSRADAVTQSPYIIVSDIDEHYARAVKAGATITVEIKDEDYGGRVYSCRDPQNQLWNFGSYDPWQTDA